MIKFRSRSPVRSAAISLFATALAICGLTQSASAGSIILYNAGSGWNVLESSTTGVASQAGPAALGGFGISLLANVTGVDAPANVQTSSINLTASGAGSISLLFLTDGGGANGFTSPTAPPMLALTTTSTGAGGTNVTGLSVTSFVKSGLTTITGTDATDVALATTPNLYSVGPTASTAGLNGSWALNGLNGHSVLIPNLASPYSIGVQFDVSFGGAGGLQITSATSLAPVPEPTSMTLLGIGLFGMAGYGWRRRRQQQQVAAETVA